MGRTHYFTATSLDGFIATPEHSLDWLLSQDNDPRGPMGYEAFIEDVGALVMGASTYRWVLGEIDEWPYRIPTWVLTHQDFGAPPGDVRFASGDVRPVHAAMTEAAGGRDLWVVGGGELAGQFADAGLLDEVWVQYAPVTLGAGAPLMPRRLDLQLVDIARNGAFLCGHYTVTR